MYYYTTNNDSVLDQRLKEPIEHIKNKLSGHCLHIALQAICYRFYPQCDHLKDPKPIKICRDECDRISYGSCHQEFRDANLERYLKKIIPGCRESSEPTDELSTKCVELKDEGKEVFRGFFVGFPSCSENFYKKILNFVFKLQEGWISSLF